MGSDSFGYSPYRSLESPPETRATRWERYRVYVYVVIASVAVTLLVLWKNKDHQDFDRMIQAPCGQDVVYSYERFGALSSRDCYKVVCFQLKESASYTRFKCEDEVK